MKKLHLILFMIFAMAFLQVYPQTKPQKNDEMPSKQELDEMMKEMQEEMKNMDPETRKIMKEMGIEIPDMEKVKAGISGLSEADMQKAWENEGKTIPDKDEKRIAFANSKRLTQANVGEYVKQVHQAVSAKAGVQQTNLANEIYVTAKAGGGSAMAANGLWMFGANVPAVLVLGKTLAEQNMTDDDLNNYAAFLIMTGAEQAALPILNYLDAKYPKNSTILNNIGQAWFGLGVLDKATEYFDKALALYPGHSQANFTKSLIQEHKGDKSGALSSMKRSIKTGYSITKESRLNEMNYNLKSVDISWKPPFPQDPLGFGQMNWPNYPNNVAQSETLEREWEVYRETIKAKSAAIEEKLSRAEKNFEDIMNDPAKMMQNLMNTNLKLPKSAMPFSSKAKAKLEYYNEDDDVLALKNYEEQLANLDNLQDELSAVDKKFGNIIEEYRKTNPDGEGSKISPQQYCDGLNEINNKYLANTNQILEVENLKWIEYWRKSMSRRLNYIQYALPEDAFELEKLRAQMMWLALIGGQKVSFISNCKAGSDIQVKKQKGGALPDFYDMTCKQKSVMNLGIGKITIECNKMTTELDAGFLKYSQRENMDNGTIIRGTVEIGKGFSLGDGVKVGPVKAELKVTVGAFIEFDSEGITDSGVKGGVSAEVGTDVLPEGIPSQTGISEQSVTFGAEAKWGWNSGGSIAGKGLLGDLSIK